MTQQSLGENYLRVLHFSICAESSVVNRKKWLLERKSNQTRGPVLNQGGGDYFLPSNLEFRANRMDNEKSVSVLLLSKAAKFVRLCCGPKSALPTLEIPDYLYQEVRDSYAKHWAHRRRFEGKGEYYTKQYCTISPNT